MLYNTFEFLISFLVVAIIYYIIPKKLQWIYLLLVSYGYYFTFSVKHSAILLFSTVITYLIARIMEKCKRPKVKKLLIISCVLLNVGLLGVFKYFSWLLETINSIFYNDNVVASSLLTIAVPVGISFYTFKAVSYIVDVYKQKICAEKNFGKYALYVSFFPQIVSGPIERAANFLPQLERGYCFDYNKVKNGFLLFLWGLFKKIVIADRLAILVNQVFNNVSQYSAPDYCLAILFFTLQIYFDFAGYSDMAIGCINILGMDSVRNFDRPYFSKSIAEFWRRWHISLSTWFRDYLYIPLGGNRVTQFRWAINIMVVFLISGLWHGANWTFVIWGALHGVYQIIGKLTKGIKVKILSKIGVQKDGWLYQWGAMLVTFLLVAYAWMFFRANSLQDAYIITRDIFLWKNGGFNILNLGMQRQDVIFSFGIIIFFFLVEALQSKVVLRSVLQKQILPVRWAVYLLIIFTCIMFGIYGDLSTSSFVYFQF